MNRALQQLLAPLRSQVYYILKHGLQMSGDVSNTTVIAGQQGYSELQLSGIDMDLIMTQTTKVEVSQQERITSSNL